MGAAKACNHARSGLTQKVNVQKGGSFKLIKRVLTEMSGQLRNLGLICRCASVLSQLLCIKYRRDNVRQRARVDGLDQVPVKAGLGGSHPIHFRTVAAQRNEFY